MTLFQGVVEAVSDKKSVFNTKNGPAYNFNFKCNGNWFQLPFCKPEAPLPLQAGQQVEFMYETTQNGQYTNNTVNKKTLNVNGVPFAEQPMPGGSYQQPPPNQQAQQQQFQQPPQQQAPAQQAPMRNSKKVPGIAVGMALNNAVALVAAGKVENLGMGLLQQIENVAWDILTLNDKMNKMVEQGFYPNEQQAPSQNQIRQEQQQPPVPQQQTPPFQAPPQQQGPQQAPPQQQQQSQQQQQGGYQQQGQPPGNPPGFADFDDDIPF